MAKINSCKKGKVGELELVHFLKERGIGARRGQQHAGGTDSPDVVTDYKHVHFECKRVERGNPYDWLAQAQRDGGEGKIHVVAHKRNRHEWIAILPLDQLVELLKRDVTVV
jgi:Holliday junction resolvase